MCDTESVLLIPVVNFCRRERRFFVECKDAVFMYITIGGGEPFIKEDLKEIIEGIVAYRM